MSKNPWRLARRPALAFLARCYTAHIAFYVLIHKDVFLCFCSLDAFFSYGRSAKLAAIPDIALTFLLPPICV